MIIGLLQSHKNFTKWNTQAPQDLIKNRGAFLVSAKTTKFDGNLLF
jgi:hypothetical protein